MGIQTFQDSTLKLLQRRHTAEQAIRAFQNCRTAGFRNISIDLMYGLPGETLASWEEDLKQALALHPEHISAYHLIYEEGTTLWQLREQHKLEEADEDLSVSLFGTLIDSLTAAGYEHYEISNFCLPGFHSRHNSSYWTEKKYLGCGPSAHSYNGTSRQWNVASLNEYIRGISNGNPTFEVEELDSYTRYNDFVITHIRTQWGMPLPKLRKQYGEELYKYCLRMATPHLQQGTLEIKNDTLKLTRKGIFISDGIMSDMLWVEYNLSSCFTDALSMKSDYNCKVNADHVPTDEEYGSTFGKDRPGCHKILQNGYRTYCYAQAVREHTGWQYCPKRT